jgi:crossover junction endodeoxyribonuclease RusA
MTVIVFLPWPPSSLSPNARTHWAVKAKATRKARRDAYYAAREAGLGGMTGDEFRLKTIFNPPARYGYDEDNLKARCKALYDGISDALGFDDKLFRHEPVEIGDPVKGGSVRVEITAVEAGRAA